MFNFSGIEAYHKFLDSEPGGCTLTVEHYLKLISAKAHLNAFVEVYAEKAMSTAKSLDKKRSNKEPIGALHGVVVAIKDVICYKDHKISASSGMLQNFTSLYNATVVEKLLAADAIIIGICNCDEFAMGSTSENSFYGNVLNALDETKVPGGSSGGSAVAVQAGLSMVSLGTDTGGSVRQPADFCGIIGLKPTYGRISRYGIIAYASSFDQVGIFGKYVDDVAKVLSVISGSDEFDSTVLDIETDFTLSRQQERKYRIAYFSAALDHPALDPEISKGIKSLLNELSENGHVVSAVDFELIEYIVPTYYVLTTAEASSNLSRYDGVRFGHRTKGAETDLTNFYKQSRSEGFGLEVKRRIMLGNYVLSEGYYDAYFTKAQQVRRMLVDKVNHIFENFDAIILPTVPTTAVQLGKLKNNPVEMYLADIFTVLANLTGIPAMSVPLAQHSNNMPFGVQIMTSKLDELTLLHLGEMITTRV